MRQSLKLLIGLQLMLNLGKNVCWISDALEVVKEIHDGSSPGSWYTRFQLLDVKRRYATSSNWFLDWNAKASNSNGTL